MLNIHKEYKKWDIKISDVIQKKESHNNDIEYKFELWNKNSNSITTIEVFKFVEENKADINDIFELYTVSYFKNDIKDKFHSILCIGTKENFNDNIFTEKLKPSESLITLEENWEEFLNSNLNNPILSKTAIKYPWERTYTNINKDIYDSINSDLRRFIQRWIEDWTFKIPFMAEIYNK